ncbi:type II secretion system protein N [Undibacterium baiyunense]|uniref:Type II secretion system protein N n=1 Tax=Undibacterium baiyunense TaxID=2828731 RepID=A0A941I1A5_9BURK|nr:type II secretion system protein N [Undibacterium baiyunense]MBR7744967.1 type II secretion system protein N [Undibacterium baiyunense]
MQKKVVLAWCLVGILSTFVSVLIFLPASWVGVLLEKQTMGRLSLGDIQGSFWRGSAFIGGAVDQKSAVTPLFPGRFSWKISPAILLGQVAVELENTQVMSAPLQVKGSFQQWYISPASITLPPERLEGLGAPLNTIGPTGKIALHWGQLDLSVIEGKALLNGTMKLEMNEMASRASSVKPLGSYLLAFNWKGDVANLVLSTHKGPMMLEGNGVLQQGRFRFSGKAFAEQGQEERMANLLNLLGRRRQEGDKQVIALEYN